ncbi:TAXI family TRAP transporter solute-binding subunit [Acuticoccus sediminis]|nr:TAXI family TRAP transporter solute-binding subunit [Acuticoccus sediminis]
MISRPLLYSLVAVLALAIGGALAWWELDTGGPATLRLSAGTSGGTYAVFGEVLARSLDPSDVADIVSMPSAGASQNAKRIHDGEADLGLIQGDTPVAGNVTVMARLFPEAFHLVAREGAGIESVHDLRGKTVGLMPPGAGSNGLFDRLLAHYEVPHDSLTIIHGSLSDHAESIRKGEIDAFFMVVALGNQTIQDIIKSTPTQLVAIDQAEAMALFDPALEAKMVPVGTYSGDRPVPNRPIPVVSVRSLLAVGRQVPEATVEAVTRALFERRQAMVRQLPQAAFITAPTEEERLAFGVHPGADRYYRQDDPIFIVEYAEPLALGVTALALLASGLWQARIWLANARKNRADHYNLEIVELVSRIEEAKSDSEYDQIRLDLFALFERVIVDLDLDRIEEKSLLSFSFAWQAAASTLNHRQLLLRSDRTTRAPEPLPVV